MNRQSLNIAPVGARGGRGWRPGRPKRPRRHAGLAALAAAGLGLSQLLGPQFGPQFGLGGGALAGPLIDPVPSPGLASPVDPLAVPGRPAKGGEGGGAPGRASLFDFGGRSATGPEDGLEAGPSRPGPFAAGETGRPGATDDPAEADATLDPGFNAAEAARARADLEADIRDALADLLDMRDIGGGMVGFSVAGMGDFVASRGGDGNLTIYETHTGVAVNLPLGNSPAGAAGASLAGKTSLELIVELWWRLFDFLTGGPRLILFGLLVVAWIGWLAYRRIALRSPRLRY